ncbi:leucine-rich repeat neuronal protein 1-like [Mizuhopecten yessoensis]|uniref:leucine-rich repeat neuronal protein 1-like n=1 Tax=Mizuhopecten yessoensis TaxID=6573 RepID=UPI000B45924D|nr:leucine-rich repeat neuronal protein 1-like [Mizuhopecten yessoensis]XP_021359496.1 leucine-rich repeat neuronal protein 1-like [Mizuhopecten yessoensis]
MLALETATLLLLMVSMATVEAQCPISLCSCSPSKENPALQVIDCRNKGFIEVPNIMVSTVPEAFYELTLAGNMITSIPNGAFSNITVNVLDLSDNRLAQISDNAFQGLESSLTILKLGGDKTATNPPSLSYTFLTSLVELLELDLRYFRLTTIDQNTFPRLTKLNALKLQTMKIQSILENGFQDKFPVLKKLEIVGNTMMGNVPVSALRFLTTLNHLTLQQNNISYVAFASFETLTNLVVLDLSHNEITTLGTDCFKGLYSKLEFLSLFLNKLDQTQLQPIYTQNWTVLEQLNIANNMVTDIPTGFFLKMQSLAYLNLNDNKLTTIKTTYFTALPSIHQIDLNYNPIAAIEDGSFSQVPTLKQLDMEHFNSINPSQRINFTTASVRGLENSLERLNLMQTLLMQDEAWKAIKTLTRLTQLVLHGSGLTAIPHLVFSDHVHLFYLDLSNNQISVVQQETLHGLQDVLQTLDLQHNRIPSIDECVLKGFNALSLLYLNDNPTHCNCTMKWLKDLNNSPPPDSYRNDVLCVTPASLVNRNLFDLNDTDLGCAGYVAPTCPDLSVTTTPAPPPTTTPVPTLPLPTLTSIITENTKDSIAISWNINDLQLISGFRVSYTSAGVTQEIPLSDKNRQSYTITSLSPDTSYRVCVHVVLTDITRAPVESCHDITTLMDLPTLTAGIASTTTTTMKLTWIISNSPLVTGFSLTYYKFGTINSQVEVPLDSSMRELTIEGLQADNKYEVCLKVLLTVSGIVIKCDIANTKIESMVGPGGKTDDTGPNGGVIAGAVVGCVVAVVIIVAILYILFIRKGSPKQPLPTVQQTSFSTAGFPTTDHARRFVKSKPAQNGGGKDIQVISSGKMDQDDASRISGGSYQFLNEGQVTLQPIPFNKRAGANGSSLDYVPPSKHKYANVGYNSSPNPPSKNKHSYTNAPQPPKGSRSVYTNDIDKRPLPTEPQKDESGFTNKGFKSEMQPNSPTSPATPNVYHEIPI